MTEDLPGDTIDYRTDYDYRGTQTSVLPARDAAPHRQRHRPASPSAWPPTSPRGTFPSKIVQTLP